MRSRGPEYYGRHRRRTLSTMTEVTLQDRLPNVKQCAVSIPRPCLSEDPNRLAEVNPPPESLARTGALAKPGMGRPGKGLGSS